MNVANATCAPAGEIDWEKIEWSELNCNVKRLQARIVKATQQGRWNKVKALQHLLLTLLAARHLP